MISIITPVLNESENIKPFIENLNSLSGIFELILVDGGSIDTTIKEIKKSEKTDKDKNDFFHRINTQLSLPT